MLHIIFQSGKERKWHIGEKNPVNFDEVNAIQEIQADGDELDYIKKQYCDGNNIESTVTAYSIPLPRNKRVVRWFGDIAKIIISNI